MSRIALLLAMLLALAAPAAAEKLVLSVSQPQVRITSSFSGGEVVLFGAIEGRAPEAAYDLAVTVRGPQETLTTWRKSRVLGLWINTDSRTFVDTPSYLAVAANRPLAQIAPAELLRREQIGLARNIFLQKVGSDFADVVPDDPFRTAFLRVKTAEGLYGEDDHGVTFLSPTAFRATFRIPERARTGNYDVAAKLLLSGGLVAEAHTVFNIAKDGFEAQLANLAQRHALLYGITVACGALIIGFIANLLFRKD